MKNCPTCKSDYPYCSCPPMNDLSKWREELRDAYDQNELPTPKVEVMLLNVIRAAENAARSVFDDEFLLERLAARLTALRKTLGIQEP